MQNSINWIKGSTAWHEVQIINKFLEDRFKENGIEVEDGK